MQDIFAFIKQSVLETSTPIDCTQDTQILGFEIGGAEPENSKRRFLFEVEGKIYRFEGNNLLLLDCDKSCREVLELGNTAAELLAVTDIPSWCGKYIYPIIALSSPANASVMPSVALGIKAKSFNDIFQKSQLSPVYYLGENSKIADIDFTKATTGGGQASLQIKLLQDNIWSSFMSIDDALNKNCQAFQLKTLQTVTSSSGSSSSQITGVEIDYCKFSGEVTSEYGALYFKAEDFDEDLSTAYCLIKHNYLDDNDLKVFACFDDLPTEIEEVLGVGTGSPQTFDVEEGIDFDSLKIFVGGVMSLEYTLNAAAGTLTITAPEGEEISIKYKCKLAAENWLELEKQFTILDENAYSGDEKNSFTSRYVLRLEGVEKSKVAKIKVENRAGLYDAVEIYKVAAGFSL